MYVLRLLVVPLRKYVDRIRLIIFWFKWGKGIYKQGVNTDMRKISLSESEVSSTKPKRTSGRFSNVYKSKRYAFIVSHMGYKK